MSRTSDVRPFDRLARWYDLLMPGADDEMLETALGLAERPVRRGLDLAGGTGRAARALPAAEWTVVDAAEGMLEQARDSGFEAVRADASRLPFDAETVDAVVIVDALHHIGDQKGALAEAARVLRPGGVLAVVEFDPETIRGRALVAGEHLLGFSSSFVPPTDLSAGLRRAGFSTLIPESGFEYVAVGVKPRER